MINRMRAFFRAIAAPMFTSPQDRQQRRLEDMLDVVNYAALFECNPQRITVEDVARIMDIDEEHAQSILDECVREGSHVDNYDGTYRLVDIDTRIAQLCDACDGSGLNRVGETFVDSPCKVCEGTGRK